MAEVKQRQNLDNLRNMNDQELADELANQRFKLWQAPLTWLPAGTTPSGAASTLQVRVNGVLWTEVDSFAV